METGVAATYIRDWNENVITVKQKIEKLKAWHKAKEEKLLQKCLLKSPDFDNSINLDGINSSPKDLNVSRKCKEISLEPEYNFCKNGDISEQPVGSGHNDFYSLLDSKLQEGIGSDVQTSNKVVEKKPFLRKGEGLTRFRLKSQDFKLKKKTDNTRQDNEKSNVSCTKRSDRKKPTKHSTEKEPVILKKTKSSPLEAFEILEEKASDSSFCSTSSMVAELMEDSIKSTPIKSNKNSNLAEKGFSRLNLFGYDGEFFGLRTLDVIDEEPSKLECSKYESGIIVDNSDLQCKVIRINTNEQTDKNYCTGKNFDNSECSSECSCCHDTSNMTSTSVSIIAEETTVYSPLKSQSHREIHCATIDQSCYSSNNYSTSIRNETFYDENDLQSLLQTRILQLETEIDAFRTENAQMIKLRNDYEKEYKKFCEEKLQLLSKIRAEHLKGVKELEEEKKKFRTEQAAFEKYVKEIKSRPIKQEKEEIRLLKEEINLLKEEMNRKESRWAAAQARIRTEMKLLKDHNTVLKEELNELKKPVKKVTFASTLKKSKSSPNISGKEKIHPLKPVTKKNQNKNQLCLPEFDSSGPSPAFDLNNIRNKNTIQKSFENSRLLSDDCSSISSDLRRSICVSSYVNEDTMKNCDIDMLSKEPDTMNIEEDTRQNLKENCEGMDTSAWEEIWYSNGSVKKISPDGKITKTIYYNGDVEETSTDEEIVKYYHAESKIWHKQFKDGLEIKEFPNGQIEKAFQDGTKEITLPNGTIYTESPTGVKKLNLADGTVIVEDNRKREKQITFPNGEIEVHTTDYMRREYPDGRIRIIYTASGMQETKYPNGRIRLKSKDGILLSDSGIS